MIGLKFKVESYGMMCVHVLRDIWGHPFDKKAELLLCALRPSEVRVSPDEVKTDYREWRVTVYLNTDDTISSIEQEVLVGTDGPDFPNGYALWQAWCRIGVNL